MSEKGWPGALKERVAMTATGPDYSEGNEPEFKVLCVQGFPACDLLFSVAVREDQGAPSGVGLEELGEMGVPVEVVNDLIRWSRTEAGASRLASDIIVMGIVHEIPPRDTIDRLAYIHAFVEDELLVKGETQ